MPTVVAAALADLAAAFASLGVRWYVFGAQAVIAAGLPRLTADIDVTVEPPTGGTRALLAALARHGISLRDVGDVRAFIAETRVVPATHTASTLPIDIVLAGPGLELEMMDRAHRRDVDGVEVPLIDLADLIALKILAGRDKDSEDVRALLRAAPAELSIPLARERVGELAALLDDSTLLTTFERLVAETRPPGPARKPARRKPPPKK